MRISLPTRMNRLFPRMWPGGRAVGLRSALNCGFVVGLLTTINTLSYALVAGAPFGSQQSAAAVLSGLIGAVVGGAVATLLGSVPAQVFAPRASVAVVIAGAAAHWLAQNAGLADALPRTLVTITACLLLAALIQLGFGLLRLGDMIRMIPQPVTAGLTIAIAIRLFISQWEPFVAATGLGDFQRIAPLACGVATVIAIAWGRRRRVDEGPALMAGLIVGIALSAAFEAMAPAAASAGASLQPHLDAVDWSAGPLLAPLGLLRAWHTIAFEPLLPNLCAFALVLALVNSMETLTSAMVLEHAVGRRFDANRALMAGAAGSLAATCLGGLPVAGSATTSLANLRAGSRARMSALMAAGMSAALTMACGSWLVHVPMAVIAGMMTMVAITLVAPPLAELWQRWRRRAHDPRGTYGDLAVAALVCGLLLASDMLVAVCGGLVAATALALLSMRASLVRRHYDATHTGLAAQAENSIDPAIGRTIQIIELGQPLFFATVEAAVLLVERSAASMRFTVLDLRHVAGPDATAASALARCFASLHGRGHQLALVRRPEAPPIEPALQGCPVFGELAPALLFCASQATRDDSTVEAREHQVGVEAGDSEHRPPAPDDVDRELARQFGPLAPLLLRKACREDPDVSELLEALMRLPGGSAPRRELLSGLASRLMLRSDACEEATSMAPSAAAATPLPEPRSIESAPASLPAPMSALEPMTAAVPNELVEHAARDLALHLGPIATLLARRAQRSAGNRKQFFEELAARLDDPAARKAFLAASGRAPRPRTETLP